MKGSWLFGKRWFGQIMRKQKEKGPPVCDTVAAELVTIYTPLMGPK